MPCRSSILLLFLAACAPSVRAKEFTIKGPEKDLANAVVSIPSGKDLPEDTNAVELSNGRAVPAQWAGPMLAEGAAGARRLVFVVPSMKAGEDVRVKPLAVRNVANPPAFSFKDSPEGFPELSFVATGREPRKVLQYFSPKHSATDHYYTFKPFHNLFDPVEGTAMITNTSAKSAKDGQFPHHRGLFFGFNRISYGADGGKKSADIWHGTANVYSEHEKMLATEAGTVLGRHRALIAWHGIDGKIFAEETREVTAYDAPGGILLDWNTVLASKSGAVRLDGDPQHAGFHFRANQEVARNGKQQTYYLRPDGRGRNGETRNWDAKGRDPKTVNLPWNAMSFVTGDKRYTALRVNHPSNPGETRGSEREYGRFGDYFEYDLTPEKPLSLRYRVWVQAGEMTVPQCEAIARGFAQPPRPE